MKRPRRRRWPAPTTEELRELLLRADKLTLRSRVKRLRFVFQEFGEPSGMLLMGGMPAMLAIQELKGTFVHGEFVSSVVAAQAFVEHSLASSFSMMGDDRTANSGFAKLIEAMAKKEWLTRQMADRLHVLRNMRNPYTHPKTGQAGKGYMDRMQASGIYDPYKLAASDAAEAIRIVVDWLRVESSSFEPNSVRRSVTKRKRPKST